MKWMALLLSGCCFASEGSTFDWLHHRGPNLDGIVFQDNLILGSIREVWKTNVGTGYSSIVTSQGRVITMGNEGGNEWVICLDSLTGGTLWKHEYACSLNPNMYAGGPNASPTVHNNRVFTLSREGHVFCLDLLDGSLIWSFHAESVGAKPPTWGYSGAPTVWKDRLILNVGDSGLALRLNDGEVIWSTAGGGAGYATPVPFEWNGQWMALLFAGKKLLCVDPENGRERWYVDWETNHDINAATPILIDNHIFISSAAGNGRSSLLSFTDIQAEVVWKNENLKNQFNTSVFFSGYIYGIDGNTGRHARLTCIDSKTGEVTWTKDTGFGSLRLVNDLLFVLDHEGVLHVVKAKPDQYDDVTQMKILDKPCWTVPTIDNGRLFARNASGDLVCINITE